MIPVCKHCGQHIRWIQIEGKNTPVNAKAKTVAIIVGRNAQGTAAEWKVVVGNELHAPKCPVTRKQTLNVTVKNEQS